MLLAVMTVSYGIMCSKVLYKFADVSVVTTISVIRAEALSTSETSVNLYETTMRSIPEDSHLTRRRENLNCHLFLAVVVGVERSLWLFEAFR
jgi:hypothetical protein